MLKLFAAVAALLAVHAGVYAGEAQKFAIANLNDAADLGKLEYDKTLLDLEIGPRTVTDTGNVMKFQVRQGQYPGFTVSAPKNMPADWSKFEALSFIIWSANDTSIAIRIDDEKSFNYNSRFNGGMNIQKGRTLVQIPIVNIAKSINPAKIKAMVIFLVDPPKGTTLHFGNLMLGPLQDDKVDFIPYAERYDLTSSTEFATPHIPAARNLAGGPVPVFMLTSVKYGREVPEMMQRMDLKVSQLTWDREWGANTWGFGDFYGLRGHSIDYVLMQKYLDSSMQGPEKFGALVLYTPLGWNRFTASARKAIIKRVKENGEGLVFVMPFPGDQGKPWPDDLKEICALTDSATDWLRGGDDVRYPNEGRVIGKKWVKAKDHPIVNGVPLEALPFQHMEVQQYKAAPDAEVLIATESGEPVLAVRQVGKGRVVTIAARAFSLTPMINPPREFQNKIPYRFWEAWYSLENRAILWAAGREFKRDGAPVELKLDGDNADRFFTARQWKDAAGKVTDWELTFATPKNEPKAFAITVPESVQPGETIKVAFTPPADAGATEWAALLGEIVDNKWRTLESITLAANAPAELPTKRVRALMAYVKIEGRKDGAVVALGKGEVVVSPEAKWDDYEIHSWLESGIPFLADYEDQRMRDFGLTCNTVSPWDVNGCKALFRGGMRVHGCGLTGGLHAHDIDGQAKRFNETHDKKELIRNPSYADAAFVAKEREQVQKYAEILKPFAPLSMIMSDETALTSYTREFDFDFHPDNVINFRAKMKAKFGAIEALNAAFGTTYPSFEKMEPPTSDEAKAAKNFGLWNEWRAFNDDMWSGAFKMYGDAMKEKFPATRVSVSGTQESAIFNGIDWAKLTPMFGAVSGYGGRFQELQRMNFHPGGLRVTPWGAYGRSGRAVDHQVWASLTTGGSGMGLFWWLSLRNADLTFSKSGQDYQRVFNEIRTGTGKQYMLAARQFSPVAVLWSPDSQRASWTLGQFDEFKKVEAAVVNALTDAEFDPYFISQDQLVAGDLSKHGTKVIVLPMSLSLGIGAKKGGQALLPALEKFAAAGGMVVVTHDLQFDEFLQPAKWPEALAGKLVKFDAIKADLVGALGKAGAKPWLRCAAAGARVKGLSATLHKLPGADAFLVTLIRTPIGAKDVVGADGVMHSVPDAEGGKELETVTVDVSALGKVNFYDIRKKAALTATDGKLTIEVQAGGGLPIASLPYTVEDLSVTASNQDRMLSVTWALKTSAQPIATHVMRVEVIDAATGQPDRNLSANVNTGADGKGAYVFPLALEDANRKLSVRVHDILSGKTAEAKP